MPIEFVATSRLPTAFGEFNITVFQDPKTGEEHVALSKGLDQPITEPVLVRVHSECLTGDAFASLKCDCGPQLQATQKLINEAGQGVILYLRQEGRGIGLTNKIRAYALQDQGHDTVDANLMLNLPADARRYDMVSIMLDHLNIQQVRLITNNPLKIAALQEQGINVVDRVPFALSLLEKAGLERFNQIRWSWRKYDSQVDGVLNANRTPYKCCVQRLCPAQLLVSSVA